MDRIAEAAHEVASDRLSAGSVVLPRSTATRAVKDLADSETVSKGSVRAGFEEAGWEYGRYLYFHPGAVRDRCTSVAQELLAEGALLTTHARICDEVAGPVTRSEESGWESGPFVDTVQSAFARAGWAVRTLETATGSRTVYVYPLDALIADQYPRGLTPHSPVDLFTFYVGTCIELARDRETRIAGPGQAPGDADLAATITGIGPTFAARLRAAEIESVADLAAAEPTTVAEVTDAGLSRARDWIDQARG